MTPNRDIFSRENQNCVPDFPGLAMPYQYYTPPVQESNYLLPLIQYGNFELILITTLLLGLPIVIYLAYLAGKRRASKKIPRTDSNEDVTDLSKLTPCRDKRGGNRGYEGDDEEEKSSSTKDSTENVERVLRTEFYREDREKSDKCSSTHSSPGLPPLMAGMEPEVFNLQKSENVEKSEKSTSNQSSPQMEYHPAIEVEPLNIGSRETEDNDELKKDCVCEEKDKSRNTLAVVPTQSEKSRKPNMELTDNSIKLKFDNLAPKFMNTRELINRFGGERFVLDENLITNKSITFETKIVKEDGVNQKIETTVIKTALKPNVDIDLKAIPHMLKSQSESSVAYMHHQSYLSITDGDDLKGPEVPKEELKINEEPTDEESTPMKYVINNSIDRTSSPAIENFESIPGQSGGAIIAWVDPAADKNKVVQTANKNVFDFDKLPARKDSQKEKSDQSNSEKNTSTTDYLNRTTSNQSAKSDIQKLAEKYELPEETGKFQKIFADPIRVGDGAFGFVFKVKHRLDGKTYAVKKVKLNLTDFEALKKSKVFREVFAMTEFNHPNIVRYSTCWVEVESCPEPTLKRGSEKLNEKDKTGPLSGISEDEESQSQDSNKDFYYNDDESKLSGLEWARDASIKRTVSAETDSYNVKSKPHKKTKRQKLKLLSKDVYIKLYCLTL